jgi:hypothetical protein
MERNIGAPNRRIPPDVRPMGSASRDLDREDDYESEPAPLEQPEIPDASIVDAD